MWFRNYLNCLLVSGLLCAWTVFAANEICQTTACKELSDELLHHSMNESVAPCDNFYEYVCGKWPVAHPLEHGHSVSWFNLRRAFVVKEIDEAFLHALNSTNTAVQSVAQFYSDCLDSETIEKRGMTPLIESVEKLFGAWPMLHRPQSSQPQPKHWQDLFVNIVSQTGISPVFDIRSYYNSTNKKYIVNIQSGPITNNARNVFPTHEAQLEKYKNIMHKIAVDILKIADNDKLKNDIEAILHLEQKLHTASIQSKKIHDFHGNFADLKVATQNRVDWLSIVNQILTKMHTQVPQFSQNDAVHARVLTYLSESAEILNTTPLEVIQNWLGWTVTFQMGTWTTVKMQKELLGFLGGKYDPTITKSICNSMPFHWSLVMGRIYIDKFFSNKEKKEADILVSSIKSAFKENLQHTDWLDAKTRSLAIEKLEAMGQTVGYSPSIISDDTIKNTYPFLNNQTIQKGKFFESQFILRVDVKRSNLNNLRNVKHDSRGMEVEPTTINAFYSPNANTISIPAGILQPPFFDDERPFSMNYGAIGTVIGHELTHGFDNNGRKHDLHGKLVNWWTNETLDKFNEKAKCFEEEYSKIHDPLTGLNLNGTKTLPENIADNGGIKKAFLAYQAHQTKFGQSSLLPNLKLTSDQLFFVSYAHINCATVSATDMKRSIQFDVHSPNRYRVNVVLGNTPQFASAFNCPVGSTMNRAKKCSLW